MPAKTKCADEHKVKQNRLLSLQIDKIDQFDLKEFTNELQCEYRNTVDQLERLEEIYKHLTQEGSRETLDERRINFLKAQIFNLENQLCNVYCGLSNRSKLIAECLTSLDKVISHLRTLIDSNKGSDEITFRRSELTNFVDMLSNARRQLFSSCSIAESIDKSAVEIMRADGFNLDMDSNSTINYLDLCVRGSQGSTLSILSVIEARTATLLKSLHSCQQSLLYLHRPLASFKDTEEFMNSYHALSLPLSRTCSLIEESLNSIEALHPYLLHCCVLIPQQRNSLIKRSHLPQILPCISTNTLAKILAPHCRGNGYRNSVQSLVNAAELNIAAIEVERQASNRECEFHSSVLDLIIEKEQELFTHTKLAFDDFLLEVNSLLQPLTFVLKEYDDMTSAPSDKSLRTFVKTFRDNSEQIKCALRRLNRNTQSQQMSEISAQFLWNFEKLKSNHASSKRKDAMLIENARNDLERFKIYEASEFEAAAEEIQAANSVRGRRNSTTATNNSEVSIPKPRKRWSSKPPLARQSSDSGNIVHQRDTKISSKASSTPDSKKSLTRVKKTPPGLPLSAESLRSNLKTISHDAQSSSRK